MFFGQSKGKLFAEIGSELCTAFFCDCKQNRRVLSKKNMKISESLNAVYSAGKAVTSSNPEESIGRCLEDAGAKAVELHAFLPMRLNSFSSIEMPKGLKTRQIKKFIRQNAGYFSADAPDGYYDYWQAAAGEAEKLQVIAADKANVEKVLELAGQFELNCVSIGVSEFELLDLFNDTCDCIVCVQRDHAVVLSTPKGILQQIRIVGSMTQRASGSEKHLIDAVVEELSVVRAVSGKSCIDVACICEDGDINTRLSSLVQQADGMTMHALSCELTDWLWQNNCRLAHLACCLSAKGRWVS